MREIKFRVWTGLKMEYNIMAGFLGAFYVQGIDSLDSASMSPFNTKYFDDTPLMQFTGLKDKNGVDIYEGDLISEDGSKPYEVIWQYHSVQWIMQDTGEGRSYRHMALDYAKQGYEVIGNIYQNPELLK